MDVVRDMLDKPVVDRNNREMGRVDGIVIECEGEEPPRISSILIGATVLGDRVHPWARRCAAWLERRLDVSAERPVTIDSEMIEQVDRAVKVKFSIGETGALAVEHRLRRWVLKIPGSR